MRELKIVPERVEARSSPARSDYLKGLSVHFRIELIFESMSSCAALHPDPEDPVDEVMTLS